MPNIPSQIPIDKIKEEHIEKIKKNTEATHSIPYRDWEQKQKQQPVYVIPIQYCKYRLENGRIKTQILTHEKVQGTLIQESDDTQKIISDYLSKSDPKTNESLKKILKKEGQKEPAVMTADGFLINGNRRKWAFEQLYNEYPEEKYKYLNVVILPGSDDPERPTVKDIALLENRFQVYITGKSEYTKMNKALTYYTNYHSGISLEELLIDDPNFGDTDIKKFKQKINKFKKEYFEPIKLMDEYLTANGIKGDYNRVANRWMSFEELAKNLTSQLDNEKFLIENNIQKHEAGLLKSAAFNIIKIKDSSEVGADNRYLIRGLPKWIKTEKKDVLKIGHIADVDDNIKDPDERDSHWQKTKAGEVVNIIKKLQNLTSREKDQQDPLNRLSEALQKLKHEDLDQNQINKMKISDIEKGFEICREIEKSNKDLKSIFYGVKKGTTTKSEKLKNKHKIQS